MTVQLNKLVKFRTGLKPAMAIVIATTATMCSAAAAAALHSIVHMNSNGRQISVAVTYPTRTPAPAVIIVPGRSGMSFYKSRIDELTRKLQGGGLVVLVPEYMGRDAKDRPQAVDEPTFRLWQHTVSDLVTFAGTIPQVRSDAIGVAGFSLGAFAAAAEASMDRRVKALAVNSAGLSEYFPRHARRMPPALIAIPLDDPVVPRARSNALWQVVCKLGSWAEVQLYDSDEHILSGDEWRIAAEENALFFRRVLSRNGQRRHTRAAGRHTCNGRNTSRNAGTQTS